MGFFSQIKSPIRAVIDAIIADPDLREQITYKRYVSGSFSGGMTSTVYSDTVFYAVRLKHTDKTVELYGLPKLSIGDFLFLIRFSDMPIDYSTKDQIVDADGNIFKVSKIDNIFDLAISVTIEGG